MKQILQNMGSGETSLVKLPVPSPGSTDLLISTTRSLISIGTERMLVEFGKANFIQKARKQPEKVKMVLEKVKTDGLATTVDAVKSKLDQPLPLGYCNVGVVSEIGSSVTEFSDGDRVVSNGPHASMVSVSRNLAAKIPDNVSDEEASFTVLGSIGLQGIRLAQPTLGETFVVTGLGLIGLLTVQLLRAHGCRVLGIDFDESKLELARQFGAETVSLSKGENPVDAGMAYSRGKGVDAVIITASTSSSDPVSQAARMCRKRGRIILVGVTGLELNRSEFYEKELTFQVSCSYGPGRYDDSYEGRGIDYPQGFVRWTQQRNFEAILDMISEQRIDVKPLISHHFEFNDAISAYDTLSDDKSALGIILNYPEMSDADKAIKTVSISGSEEKTVSYKSADPVCGFVGAGNYASRVLIPAFKKANASLHTVLSRGGVSATHHGTKNGFSNATTDADAVLKNDEINTVAIVTQHNTHAQFVIDALKNKKNVFVEKPLALKLEEIDEIERVYKEIAEPNNVRLMVGFNRRFAPQVAKVKELLAPIKQPKSFIFTMNAGAIPADTWIQDAEKGGGRIIGEACHYIDLMRFMAGSKIVDIQARRMGDSPTVDVSEDKASILLGFEDGSFGVINYFANGGKAFPKERMEVFANDAVLQIDNFRKLKGYGWQGFKKMNLWKQDKGQEACAVEFCRTIREGVAAPISAEELFEVSRASVEVAEILRNQR